MVWESHKPIKSLQLTAYSWGEALLFCLWEDWRLPEADPKRIAKTEFHSYLPSILNIIKILGKQKLIEFRYMNTPLEMEAALTYKATQKTISKIIKAGDREL
ncbi:MAG: hypothetical protein HC930_11285 [Hydrococcus sp. SU_1_0]|nr:hypothetical protein [Hydrococcus sp. SU_1_0]